MGIGCILICDLGVFDIWISYVGIIGNLLLGFSVLGD